jgi:pimeloyl-ACP methyl ester carboxylesterase
MAETIMMVHGMCGGSWVWDNYKSYFEQKGYQCIRPALRYHDTDPQKSPDPRVGTTSLLDYAEDLEREIRKRRITPVLMGHSMGGLLAQILASRGLAKALVLLSPAAPAGISYTQPKMAKDLWSIARQWGWWRKPIRPTFNESVYLELDLLSAEERKAVYDKWVHDSGRALFEIGVWFLDTKRAARVDASKLACPVLVVAGSGDRITPASCAKKIGKKYAPYVTYKEFENNAHWLTGEPGWQDIAGYIADWLTLRGIMGGKREEGSGMKEAGRGMEDRAL